MKKAFYLVLVFTVFVSSCSIKKRAYRRGYYVDWAFKKNNTKSAPIKDKQIEPKKTDEPAIEEIVSRQTNETNTDLASASKQIESVSLLQNKKLLIEKDSGCGDIITFRKGYELKAKVIEINETQIKYKPCENLNGPLVVVNKNDVFSIKYPNGYLEAFIKTVNTSGSEPKNYKGQRVLHPLALTAAGLTAAMILTLIIAEIFSPLILLLSFVLAIAGAVTAAQAKRRIRAESDKYDGMILAKMSFILCWIFLGGVILSLLIALYIVLHI